MRWGSVTGLELVVDGAACYRLTRLAVKDDLTQPLRERLIAWRYRATRSAADQPTLMAYPQTWQDHAEGDPAAPWLAALVSCRWCSSIWVGAAVVAARWGIPVEWTPVAYGLTVAAVAPLLARLEP